MKAIKLTAIATMLFLAFSCNKGKMKPIPIVNYEQLFQNSPKITENYAQNDKQNKGVWGDDQFPVFQNPDKISQ